MEAATVRQPLAEHVRELRKRIFWVLFYLLLGTGIGYWLRDSLQQLLLKPLNQPLYYTSPVGGLIFVLKICFFFGLLVAVPALVYNLIKFLEPTIPNRTRWLVPRLTIASVGLMAGGVCFAYVIVLPAALHFLTTFASSDVKSLITTNEYLSFVGLYLIGFAILFQLPLLMLFINRITPLPPRKLLRLFRFVIVIAFVVAAILTPTPDPINQTIMAVPILALYLISVALVWIVNRGRSIEAVEETAAPESIPVQQKAAERAEAESRLQAIHMTNVLDLRLPGGKD